MLDIDIDLIRVLLKQRKGDLPTVALEVKLPLRTVYNIYFGEVKNPSMRTYQALEKWARQQLKQQAN